jgi:hypothetical protein
MVVVGLATAWRLEVGARTSGSAELQRIQTACNEQERELDNVELYLLGSGELLPKHWARQRRKKREQEEALAGKYDPDKALVGEWEIVEMIYKGKVQDFQGKSGGWMTFRYGQWAEADSDRRYAFQSKYTIAGPGEIDIDRKGLVASWGGIWKCRYEISDGRLWFICPDYYGGLRPTSFDAQADPSLKLYVLQKVK